MLTVDIVLAVILLACFIYGFIKGFVSSVIHLAGLIASLVLVVRFAPLVKGGLITQFNFNPLLSGTLSYFLIFVLIMLLAKILAIVIDKMINLLNLTFLNRVLGGLFGLLNGFILLTMIFTLTEFFIYKENTDKLVNNSYLLKYLQIASDEIKSELQEKIPQPAIDIDEIRKSLGNK